MKNDGITLLIRTGIVGSLLALAGVSAKAGTTFTAPSPLSTEFWISFDGNGDINGNTANGFPYPPPSIYDVDGPPIYLGSSSTEGASYSTETPNGMDYSGFLLIYCDPNHTDLMDILQFSAFGQQYINVYSALGGTAAADVGFSSALLADVAGGNDLSVTAEDIGGYAGYSYIPTAGEPGYGGNITFTFESDAVYGAWSAPDGGMTIALLGGALIGLRAVRRKLSR